MNKTEMKKIFSKLSNIQQKVLIKALRKVSVETFNDFRNSNDIKNFNPNDMNWKYDGFVYCFNKRMDVNGKKLISFHYAKNILTNEEIKFSINDYIKIFSNKQNKSLEYAKIRSALNTVEKIIFNQIKNIIFRINHGMYFNRDVKIKQILETSDKIKELKNYEAIVNLLYYDLPLSNTLIGCLDHFYTERQKRKEFEECLSQNENYENALVLSQLCPLDEWIKTKYHKIAHEYNYIIDYYNKYKYLSEEQLQILEIVINMDFNKIDEMIEYLKSYKGMPTMDHYKVIGIRLNAVNHGLKQNRIEELEQLFIKYNGELKKEV